MKKSIIFIYIENSNTDESIGGLMFTNDYIMRQIEMLAKSVRYVFGMESQGDDIFHGMVTETSDVSKLKSILYRMVSENRFCDAENHLFQFLDKHPNAAILMTAINFYTQLNKKSDDELNKNNFPRDEIMDGLRAVEKIIAKNSKAEPSK